MAKDGEEHFVAKISQKAIIERDGKVLLVRHPKSDHWEFPGGRLNKGELPEEGLIREVKEELGVDIELQRIVAVNTFALYDEGDHLTIAYYATLKDPEQPLVLEEIEIAEVKWIDKTQLNEQPLWDDIRHALDVFFAQ